MEQTCGLSSPSQPLNETMYGRLLAGGSRGGGLGRGGGSERRWRRVCATSRLVCLVVEREEKHRNFGTA